MSMYGLQNLGDSEPMRQLLVAMRKKVIEANANRIMQVSGA